MKHKFKTGVYCITNTINGKRYIGSASVSLVVRLRTHRSRLRLGNHPNSHLQRAWIKYGEKCFRFSVLKRCKAVLCLIWEQHYLDRLKPFLRKNGYNKSPTATSVLGVRWSDESRLKMSLSKLGRRLSAESIKKRTAKQTGLKRSYETKLKMSIAARTSAKSIAVRNARVGIPRSEETKRRIAIANTGKRPSEETRAKMSIAQRRRFSKQTERNKIAIKLMGNSNRLGGNKLL